jgi:hypothetical protein
MTVTILPGIKAGEGFSAFLPAGVRAVRTPA